MLLFAGQRARIRYYMQSAPEWLSWQQSLNYWWPWWVGNLSYRKDTTVSKSRGYFD